MYVVDKATMCLAEKLADKAGTDFFTLMQNAGNAAADYIVKNTDIKDKKIFILCGKGNNGGDGFVMANQLALLGAHVFICLPLGAPVTDIANKAYGQMAKSISEIDTEIALLLLKENKFDIIIDALFGTGFSGEEPKGKIKEFFDRENKRYPNWIEQVDYDNQSLYRKLIYSAMYHNRPWMMKAIMYLRKILY